MPGRSRAFRVDFCWPHRRLILEADGRGEYEGDELWREKKREIALRRIDYRVERVIWSDAMDDWPLTSAMLREALTR